jgi:hypothetical protein
MLQRFKKLKVRSQEYRRQTEAEGLFGASDRRSGNGSATASKNSTARRRPMPLSWARASV